MRCCGWESYRADALRIEGAWGGGVVRMSVLSILELMVTWLVSTAVAGRIDPKSSVPATESAIASVTGIDRMRVVGRSVLPNARPGSGRRNIAPTIFK